MRARRRVQHIVIVLGTVNCIAAFMLVSLGMAKLVSRDYVSAGLTGRVLAPAPAPANPASPRSPKARGIGGGKNKLRS